MNHELAKTLTLALVNYIDENRPEGTMDCSSAECERLEKAFEVYNLDFVERFMEKKLSRLTEFEQCLLDYAKARDEYEFDSTKVVELNNKVIELTKSYAKELLALAKKELARRDEVITLDKLPPYDKGFQDGKAEAMADLERAVTCGNVDNVPKWLVEELNKAFEKGQESSHEGYIRGYTNGYKDAEKKYNESVAYHFPIMPTPPSGWGCDGTHCTNPQMDCINCPRKTTGGGFSTSSGTSTATLHGNTSATDGKEHNPSFTD